MMHRGFRKVSCCRFLMKLESSASTCAGTSQDLELILSQSAAILGGVF